MLWGISFVSAGIGDGAPQLDDEIVGELERLQVRIVDCLGEIHRIGFVHGQIPDLYEGRK